MFPYPTGDALHFEVTDREQDISIGYMGCITFTKPMLCYNIKMALTQNGGDNTE